MSKRVQSSVLDWFRDNDVVRMRLLTKELLFSGFFVPFLTPSQYNVLERVSSSSLPVWHAFWEGKLSLDVTHDQVDPVAEEGEENTVEETELAFKTGQNAIRALMNIVRCLLYEKAVNYHYSNKPCIEFENVLNKDLEQSNNKTSESGSESKTKPTTERDEDNDYDDEEEEEEHSEKQLSQNEEESDEMDIDLPKTEDGLVIFTISKQDMLSTPDYPSLSDTNSVDNAVAQNIHPILGNSSTEVNPDVTLQKKNELVLIKNFNKIYHTFENDVVNIMKKRKLERSNKQLEEEEDDDENDNDNNNNDTKSNNASGEKDPNVKIEDDNNSSDRKNVSNLITFGGAVNLTMKNLLNRIEEKRDDMNITDIELKNLIMDVRKNRSKWSNYNRIGQEELYEACEKVVTELRGYTEHSTPFLNKVSKREAPNYYEVIKKPMDLNTVLKNLKQLHYTNKQQFVEDLMLIWQNCLMYNSDPKHFIRKDAIAMRKKSLSLIPLIPDITIRDRIDVEREAAALAAKEKAEEESEQKGRKSTRGVGTGKKSAKKGRVSNAVIEIKDEDEGNPDSEDVKEPETMEPTPIPVPESEQLNVPNTANQDSELPPSTAPSEVQPETKTDSTTDSAAPTSAGNDVEEEERNLQETKQQGAEGEPDDLETATWKSLTSASRYRLCVDRGKLFKNGKIQPEADALLRDTNQMWNFENCLHEDPAASEKYRSNSRSYLDSGAIMHRSRQYFDETDDPYLLEYDISGGVPELKHDNTPIQEIEDRVIENLLAEGKTLESLPQSKMKINAVGGTSIVLENIGIMQDIRRVCFKINLIRQLQVNKYVHQSQFIAPEIQRIKLLDIDPMGKLPTRDLLTENIAHIGMQKAVSALVMHNGFESTKPSCAMMLTQIAETYMGNLAKSLKLHMESNSINKRSTEQSKESRLKSMLEITLCENGVENPDSLYSYYKETLVKKNTRLSDIKTGLDNFLKDLLRPSIQEMSESQFADGSDQFVNGEFSDEIGDDFFGFKELGLDKEFSMLTSSIPLHLLQSKLSQHLSNVGKSESNGGFTELSELEFPQLTKKTLYELPATMVPYLEDLLSRSKVNYHKVLKKYHQEVEALKEQQAEGQSQLPTTTAEQGLPVVSNPPAANSSESTTNKQLQELSSQFTEYTNEDDIPLMETKDLSMKQRNARAKVPPSGKISQIKKKNINLAFSFKRQDELESRMESILEKVKMHRRHLEDEKQASDSTNGDDKSNGTEVEPNQSNENEEAEDNIDEEDEEEEDEDEDEDMEEEEEEEETQHAQSSQNNEEDEEDEEDEDMVDAIDNDIF